MGRKTKESRQGLRGSVNYQINQIFLKSDIFQPGVSKHQEKDYIRQELAERGQGATWERLGEKLDIYSYDTAETYKDVWHDAGHYIRAEYGLKDMTEIKAEHIQGYLQHRLEQGIKYSTYQKECGALSKFERALNKFAEKQGWSKEYNFRDTIKEMREQAGEKLDKTIPDRGFDDPKSVIDKIDREESQIAASVQYEGGARVREATHITKEQLRGYEKDKITGELRGKIHLSNTKGGKERDITVSKETYQKLENYINQHGKFQINRNTYTHDVNRAAREAGESELRKSTHDFRYCYAAERYETCVQHGYTHEQAMQQVSWELGHERGDITAHYLR